MIEQAALIELGARKVEEAAIPLDDLIRIHARLAFQIAYSVLRNHHDAEDATQEVFLRVVRNQRKLAEVDDLRAWIARIAWRVALSRRKAAPAPDESGFEDAINQLRSQWAGGEQIAIGAQMLALTESLMAKLPDKLRAPLVLSTVEEMTSAEIAAVLGIPESSVRTRIHRARKLLKEKLCALLQGKAL